MLAFFELVHYLEGGKSTESGSADLFVDVCDLSLVGLIVTGNGVMGRDARSCCF